MPTVLFDQEGGSRAGAIAMPIEIGSGVVRGRTDDGRQDVRGRWANR